MLFSRKRSLPKLHKLSSLLCLAVLAGVVVAPTGALAQTDRGSITGRVSDSSGAMLRGAQVELKTSGQSAVTNDQGQFTIVNLTPGDYPLTVSYVGFASYTTAVKVSPGQAARVDAVMKVSSQEEEITVTAERVHGEAEAINRTRASDNILQVLPVEVITSLPNTNIADALGRMPSVTLERDEGEGKYVQIRGLEPRLSNVTIDGVNLPSPQSGVRQIKLDVIPANLVDSVEINKTLSANQDGDAIGGSVNLVTKTAEERPTLYLNGTGGYTPIIGGRSAYEIDGTVGKRFGANKKLGVLFGASYDWNGRGIDDVEPVPTTVACDNTGNCQNPTGATTDFATYSTQDLREYRYYRTRYGFTGNVDYKLGDISGLYVHFLYSHFDNFGDRWVYSPSLNSGTDANGNPTSGWLTPSLSDTNGSISFNAQIRRPVEVIGSLEAGGKHVWPRWVLAYDLSVSRSASEDHGYSSADFGGPGSGIQYSIDTTNPLKPKLVPVNGFNSVYDPSLYTLSGLDVGQSYSPQVNLQGGFSTAHNYSVGGHFSTFEFGAKLRNAHKFEDAKDPVYNSVNNPAMTQFLGTFTNSNYYDKAYTFGPTVDYGKVRAYFNANSSDPNIFTIDAGSTAQNSYPNNYDLVEHISAGYLMNTIDFGRVRLQTGLRFEGTNESLLGYQVLFDSNGLLCKPNTCPGVNNSITPVRRNSSYLDPLPTVQLRFRLNQDAAIRAVYGRGIARPNFSDMPPTFSAQNGGNQVGIGNPDLKPTYANNFDLLFEQYLKPLGLIQAGFFYKNVSDPIVTQKKLITQDFANQNTQYLNYVGQDLVQPINGSGARLFGLEISYQQHLTFLPGLMSGIGISANYGYTHSSTDGIPLRTDKPALSRQAPNTWNISPTYDRGRLSMRLGISHNDANIFSYNYQNLNSDGSPATVALGIKGANGDTYLYAHTQVDAQGAFRMYRGLQLVVSGLNLTNEVFGFYNGSTIYPIQREFYKPTYSFGLRYTFANEVK